MDKVGDQLRSLCHRSGQDLDTIIIFWLILVLGGMKRDRERRRYSGLPLSFWRALMVRWQCRSQNWGALERDCVCEAAPKSGGRQLRLIQMEVGREVAKCLEAEYRVRNCRDWFGAPEESWMEM